MATLQELAQQIKANRAMTFGDFLANQGYYVRNPDDPQQIFTVGGESGFEVIPQDQLQNLQREFERLQDPSQLLFQNGYFNPYTSSLAVSDQVKAGGDLKKLTEAVYPGGQWINDPTLGEIYQINPSTRANYSAASYSDGGGGFGDFLKMAAPIALSALGAPYLSNALGGGLLGSVGAGAAIGGISSGLTGGDPLKGALTGGLGGGLGYGLSGMGVPAEQLPAPVTDLTSPGAVAGTTNYAPGVLNSAFSSAPATDFASQLFPYSSAASATPMADAVSPTVAGAMSGTAPQTSALNWASLANPNYIDLSNSTGGMGVPAEQAPAPVTDLTTPGFIPGTTNYPAGVLNSGLTSAITGTLGNAAKSAVTGALGSKSLLDNLGSPRSLATLLAGGLDLYGVNQRNNLLKEIADRSWNAGAPSRSRFEAANTPGFDLNAIPGYSSALQTSADAFTRSLSAKSGNPTGLGSAQAETQKYLMGSLGLPAWQQYANLNANAGGLSQLSGNALNASTNVANSIADPYNVIGKTAGNIFNPPSDLQTTLANLKDLLKTNNIFVTA